VLIIRHGEKPETGTGLTSKGEERAKAYVKYFQTLKTGVGTFHPDYLFASADSKKSARERLTLEPLAKAINQSINLTFKNGRYQELADAMRAKRHGKNILICWHHGNIPKLVDALGGDSTKLIPGGKWPDAVFDWVIQLSFDSSGRLLPSQTKRIQERLSF